MEEKAAELPPLPATYVNTPGCPGCLAVTLNLRPDGSYLVRERVGASEFYDFGRWRLAGGMLHLDGGRDKRRYALQTLTRAPQLEMLRGPSRLVGLYDGATFKECRTGIVWGFTDTRAAKVLKDEFINRNSEPATLLDARACPG